MVVGADDHGIAPATSAVIRELLGRGRLTATSSMVVFPEWPDEGARLAELGDRADLGLHLTLTDQSPVGPMPGLAPGGRLPSFGVLARRALRGGIDRAEVRGELERQLDAFEGVIGRPPDYLDGHQHVHQLAGVREVVVEVLARRAPAAVVRTCVEAPARVLARGVAVTRALAFAWAGRALRRQAERAGLRTTPGFTGVYDFAPEPPFGDRAARFLVDAVPGTFWMCHPGAADAVLVGRDSLVDQRAVEAAFLGSEACDALFERLGLTRGRLQAGGAVSAPGPGR
ncbi:MAG: ChbG/HpnK family deacetylase [Alphaproteobacteria bacterium]|nr:ChbG/HpnK family deacetylase [Alphaproteobacteria bacterium]